MDELLEVLKLLEEKGAEVMVVPSAINKVLPVEADTYKVITNSRQDDDFR